MAFVEAKVVDDERLLNGFMVDTSRRVFQENHGYYKVEYRLERVGKTNQVRIAFYGISKKYSFYKELFVSDEVTARKELVLLRKHYEFSKVEPIFGKEMVV